MTRRQKRRQSARTKTVPQLRQREIHNPWPAIDILSESALETLHMASLRILRDIGLEILSERAIDLLAKAGCRIDRQAKRVYYDPEMVMDTISNAPPEFILHARNPERNCRIGGNRIHFTPIASAPNSSDLDNGRRTGNFNDFCRFLKLTQHFNICHFMTGYPVEPVDLPADSRHLDANLAFCTLTDRVWGVYSLGGGRVSDGLDMICLARGIEREQLLREPSLITVVNTNSPLRADASMLDGLIEMSEHRQPVIVTPFTLAGAMSPITLAGALAQQNAEALGVMLITQLVNPGSPVIYGGFTSNVDMKSGAPAFGTPEYARATLAGGQLARKYNLPYRSSNANASTNVDAQSAWESEMSLWSAVMGHANIIKHAAGWLEGGLCASFEKFIIDIEMLQMMAETLKPIEVNENTLAIEAIESVGPGGHFFGVQHTLERYENAFYAPLVADWSNYENWQDGGSKTATERANDIYKECLAQCEDPVIDSAIRETLEDYVEHRKIEIESAR